jgi:N-acetylmuramoyl-L-alanine amidase
MLHRRIVFVLGMLLLFVLSMDGATKRFTLCIDAGHGGRDAGAVGKMSKEKTLTLRYALAFGRIIEQNCPDVQVVYTRKTDRFVELWQRADIANKAKADLFVSVHINALPKGHTGRGYQTYTLGRSRRDGNKQGFIENLEVAKRENAVILYEKDYQQHYEGYDPNSPESNILFELIQDKNMENSISLAKFMQKNVCAETGRKNGGVYQDNLCVLRNASMPACLMELGFISTSDEEQFLNSDRAVAQYSRGFYKAFVAYKNKVAPGTSATYKPLKQEEVEPPQLVSEPEPAEATEAPAMQNVSSLMANPAPNDNSQPVFKVQILANAGKLKKNSPLLKGRTDADFYKEGNMYKYTVGASTDYQQIYQLRKSLLSKFPQAFIIAFQDGVKVDVNEARRKTKGKKKK